MSENKSAFIALNMAILLQRDIYWPVEKLARRFGTSTMSSYMMMKDDLEKEKRSIQGHWKKREKQLLKILRNTSHVYNAVRGIAGNAIQEIASLELDEPALSIETIGSEDIDLFDEPNLS